MSDAELTKELQSLRLLRATLESVHQMVQGIGEDTTNTTQANYEVIGELAGRWEDVIKTLRGKTEEEKEKKGDAMVEVREGKGRGVKRG